MASEGTCRGAANGECCVGGKISVGPLDQSLQDALANEQERPGLIPGKL